MNLFPGEELLVRSNNERIILTTHRIELSSKEWGTSYRNTIFLEDISSIEIRYTSFILALLLGILLITGGLIWSSQAEITPFNVSSIAGGFSILVYFLSRRHVVSISPNGGRAINFEIGSMSNLDLEEFIDKIQLAKLARRKHFQTKQH